MELGNYIRIARRWLWLVILFAVIAGSTAFITARSRPVVFRSSVTLQFGNYLGLSDPNPGMIQAAASLSQSYITILRSTPVTEAVVQKLNLSISPEALAGVFETRVIPDTSFLVLTVNYTDPVLAAQIAEELANQLVENSPANLTADQQEELDILRKEIREAQTRLGSSRDELKVVESGLASKAPDDADRAVLIARRAELITEINTVQNSLATMSITTATLRRQGSINYIRIFDKARTPSQATSGNPLQSTAIAAAVGAFGAYVLAFMLEFFNSSLRSPSEIVQALQVPLLGTIPPFSRRRVQKENLITWKTPRSPIAEAYRAMRVNMLFRDANDTGHHVYVITSPNPGEGKSVTSSNMAVTFAMSGLRVLLVDADLRRPTLHQIFNLSNMSGLSSLWSHEALKELQAVVATTSSTGKEIEVLENQIRDTMRKQIPRVIKQTEITGLNIVTAGPPSNSPGELLDTPQMREFTKQVVHEMQYDIVIFDSPPVLAVTDAHVLANVTGAKVVLVVESRQTTRGAAQRAIAQMSELSINVLGVVMNRLKPLDRDYDYEYYGYNQYSSNRPTPIGSGKND